MKSVSVVIPTYNRAGLIGRAVRSVLAAITAGDEIIVVDDESTDDTAAVVSAIEGPVRYVRNVHRGLGCGSARNRGIEEARKPLVAFLDSDDEWFTDKLELQRAFMEARPDVVFCFSDFEVRKDNGPVQPFALVRWHHDTRSWDQILAPGVPYSSFARLPSHRVDFNVHIGDMFRTMLRQAYVAAQSTLVRRDLIGDVRFADDVPIYEEYEFYARLTRLGPVAFMHCETFVQWGHAGERISRADQWQRADARLEILPRIWGQDEPFLATHGEAYRRCLAEERVTRAGRLIREGRPAEARQELCLAGGGPMHYHVACALPSMLVRSGVRLKRALSGLATRSLGAYRRPQPRRLTVS